MKTEIEELRSLVTSVTTERDGLRTQLYKVAAECHQLALECKELKSANANAGNSPSPNRSASSNSNNTGDKQNSVSDRPVPEITVDRPVALEPRNLSRNNLITRTIEKAEERLKVAEQKEQKDQKEQQQLQVEKMENKIIIV